MSIRVKRIYEKPENKDGYRALVDRLWPRGMRKQDVPVDCWLKEIAPSADLRKWFGHDPEKWEEFQRRYYQELEGREQEVNALVDKARAGTVTLLFGAKDDKFNNAVALKYYLEKKMDHGTRDGNPHPKKRQDPVQDHQTPKGSS